MFRADVRKIAHGLIIHTTQYKPSQQLMRKGRSSMGVQYVFHMCGYIPRLAEAVLLPGGTALTSLRLASPLEETCPQYAALAEESACLPEREWKFLRVHVQDYRVIAHDILDEMCTALTLYSPMTPYGIMVFHEPEIIIWGFYY